MSSDAVELTQYERVAKWILTHSAEWKATDGQYCGGDGPWKLVRRACDAKDFAMATDIVDVFHVEGPVSLQVWCFNDNLDALKWAVEKFRITFCKSVGDMLSFACSHGSVNVAKWLVTKFDLVANLERQTVVDAFALLCQDEYLDLMEWFVVTFKLTADEVHAESERPLYVICRTTQLIAAEWFVSRFPTDAGSVATHVLPKMCRENLYASVVWLCMKFDLAKHVRTDEQRVRIFHNGCLSGSTNIAGYVTRAFGITPELARSDDNATFKAIVRSGWTESLVWFDRQFKVTDAEARFDDNYAIRSTCECGNLKQAKWLATRFHLKDADVQACDNYAFYAACRDSWQCGCAQWLIETFNVIPSLKRDKIVALFLSVCGRGITPMAKWLHHTFAITPEEAKQDCRRTIAAPRAQMKICEDVAVWFINTFHVTPADLGIDLCKPDMIKDVDPYIVTLMMNRYGKDAAGSAVEPAQ